MVDIIDEEQVAKMRRWETEMGQKVAELETQLKETRADVDNFRWYGNRMQKVLEQFIERLQYENIQTYNWKGIDLLLAAQVACNQKVDWNNQLREFFNENH